MVTPYIIPLGFIDKLDGASTTFTLTNPEDSASLGPGAPVTVWHYSPRYQAIAKTRGEITNLDELTASFRTAGVNLDPKWPTEEATMQLGIPVYLALPNSFEPHSSRMLSQGEAEALVQKMANYAKRETEKRDDEPVP